MRSPSHLLVDRLQKVSVQNTMLVDRSLFIIVRDFKSLIKISLKYFFYKWETRTYQNLDLRSQFIEKMPRLMSNCPRSCSEISSV